MAILSYNGINIPYCNMVRFDNRAIYDDSDTDLVCIKFDIEVQGYIHLDYLGHLIDPYLNGKKFVDARRSLYQQRNAAGLLAMIRSRLLQPRRELHFWVNGVDMIPQTYERADEIGPRVVRTEPVFDARGLRVREVVVSDPLAGRTGPIANPEGITLPSDFGLAYQNPGHVDSKNGPKPQYCNVTKLTDTMIAVAYSITANYYESRKDSNVFNTVGHDVISNRWNETITVDENQYSRRVREGSYMLRSDKANKYAPQDYIPSLAALGVPDRFVRESSQYKLSSDGLGISYTVIDKEVFKLPPEGAMTATGTYKEKLGVCGVTRNATCNVTLTSSSYIRQSRLLFKAIAICLDKLVIRGLRFGVSSSPSFLEYLNYSIDMWENKVEVQAGALLPNVAPSDLSDPDIMEFRGLTWTPYTDAAVPRTDADGRFALSFDGGPLVGRGIDTIPPKSRTPEWPSRNTFAFGNFDAPLFAAAAYWDPSLRKVYLERTPQGRGNKLFEVTDSGAYVARPTPGETGVEEELFTF